MSQDQAIRSQVRSSLHGGEAFDRVEAIVAEIPPGRRFEVPSGAERSAWPILDHMRRTLEDLVAFSDNASGTYRELEWPKDYWPEEADPKDPAAWDRSWQGFLKAQEALDKLLAIQHTSYHAGELVELARILGPLGPGRL